MDGYKWHKVKEHDYPPTFKSVIVLLDTKKIHLGWYEGETRKLQWYVLEAGCMISSRHVIAWCNLPTIPIELLEGETHEW